MIGSAKQSIEWLTPLWIASSLHFSQSSNVSRGRMQTELNKVVTALTEFYAHETFLFQHDLGERSLTHRLAVHLEKHFAGWQVDCDYDRLGERTLRLPRGTIASTDD